MRLVRYRVTQFRSVVDSGWIEVDDITVLIGTNESGKTNLLIPLWKLNPAGSGVGAIDPIADYPRSQYHEIRAMSDKPVFIQAHFELDEELTRKIAQLTGYRGEGLEIASVCRKLDGQYIVEFPNAEIQRDTPRDAIVEFLDSARSEITNLSIAAQKEQALKETITAAINANLETIAKVERENHAQLHQADVNQLLEHLGQIDLAEASKNSAIRPRFERLLSSLEDIQAQISHPHPQENAQARQLVRENLLSFVYYAHYGNLDSQIYLPHVIQNMTRTDLGTKEEAKVRTLRVLFDFVKLQPHEILELGRDSLAATATPTEAEIDATGRQRTERSILLSSASADLTRRFKDWWKQGNYTFSFQADGDFFRISVSDSLRPEPIELENRSTGLQWFFSFYLVFLVERSGAHQNAMLLLDEPGLTLHPLAQRELSQFFSNLAESNQIMFTAHSPFMVDPDHLERVRSVYVDAEGRTAISSNLRARESDAAQTRSIYAVHAALGLSVSDFLLQGCQAVIVEGTSDQYYLSAIKLYLLSKGFITPAREVLFLPAGGTKGVGAITTIVTGRNESLPYVLLDSDSAGIARAKSLRTGLYQAAQERVLGVADYVSMADAEIEDLLPFDGLAEVISRYLRGPETDFDEVSDSSSRVLKNPPTAR